jgi:hypothetical protein
VDEHYAARQRVDPTGIDLRMRMIVSFRSFLASGYALKGDTDRATVELSEARRLVGDNRYSSVARLRAVDSWGVPKIRALVEATYFAGLRKAGVPETDEVAAGVGGGTGPTERQGAGNA